MTAAGTFLAGLYLGDELGIAALKDHVRGVVDPTAVQQVPPGSWKLIPTSLHQVVVDRIELPSSDRTGGAIEQVDGTVVFMLPDGRLGYLRSDGTPSMTDATVPMGMDALLEDPIADDPAFDPQYVRVTDMLALGDTPRGYEVLVSHHRYRDGCVELRVSRLMLNVHAGSVSATSEAVPVFVAEPCIGFRPGAEFVFAGHQAGGRMIAMDDGRVLLTVGDHYFDGNHMKARGMQPGLPDARAMPMDPRVSLGKILLLDPATGDSEIFTYGMRNPQGLLQDSRGRIWETEHGPKGGDELNLVDRGHNYGWPEVTLGTDYGSMVWPYNPTQGRHTGYTAPRFAWVPSIAVSNLVEAEGQEFPLWRGDLLVASLRSMTLFRLRLHRGYVQYVEPVEVGERLRDVITLDDGRIALYADSVPAILILRSGHRTGIRPVEVEDSDRMPHGTSTERTGVTSGERRGAHVFRSKCGGCHSLRNGHRGVGPHLSSLIGRRVGSVDGYAFSDVLQRANAAWTQRRLTAYLKDPDDMYPGSRMGRVSLTEEELSALLDYLASLQSSP